MGWLRVLRFYDRPTMRFVMFLLAICCIVQSARAVWPGSSQYTSGEAFVKLHDSFAIVTGGSFRVPNDLRAAMRAAEEQVRKDRMQPLEVDLHEVEMKARKSQHTLYFLQLRLKDDGRNIAPVVSNHTLMLHRNVRGPLPISTNINLPFEERDESYILEIAVRNPVASLAASNALGLLRGLQTFAQLVYTTSDARGIRYIREAPLMIQDKPAYPIRGLLLDTARIYYPIKDIKRTLDAMSWAKMN